jgi:hypothetical protein
MTDDVNPLRLTLKRYAMDRLFGAAMPAVVATTGLPVGAAAADANERLESAWNSGAYTDLLWMHSSK